MKYKDMTVEQFLESCKNPQFVREFWTDVLIKKKLENGKYEQYAISELRYYRDLVEIIVKVFFHIWRKPDINVIEIAGTEYGAETGEERHFLLWVKESFERGLNFREACLRAMAMFKKAAGLNYPIYEIDPEIDEADDFTDIEAWAERLLDQGVNDLEARSMAVEIVRLLRHEYLVALSNIYPNTETDLNLRLSEELRSKLDAPQYSDMYAKSSVEDRPSNSYWDLVAETD
jgi:hypothetical protein